MHDDALEPLAGLAPRPLLGGRYRVLGRVGLGGMSEVFIATEHVAGAATREVALKVLRAGPGGDLSPARSAELFAREGRTLLALGHHPNLCHGYELARVGDQDVIAMEWIDGVSLHTLVRALAARGERPSPGHVAAMAAQVAAGLEHAHSARRLDGSVLALVHLDVNPANIMVRYDGLLKLIDFGVARTADDPPPTPTGVVMGKFSYMAPEQLRGEPLDPRTDVFALGVCMFELLTGVRLYRHDNLQETCQAIWNAPVPSARALLASVPAELDAIVQRALQKAPGERFQSAGELHAVLEAFLVEARLPMGARPIAELVARALPGSTRALRLQPSATLDQLFMADASASTAAWPSATPPPLPSAAEYDAGADAITVVTTVGPRSTLRPTPHRLRAGARVRRGATWVGLALACAALLGASGWARSTARRAGPAAPVPAAALARPGMPPSLPAHAQVPPHAGGDDAPRAWAPLPNGRVTARHGAVPDAAPAHLPTPSAATASPSARRVRLPPAKQPRHPLVYDPGF